MPITLQSHLENIKQNFQTAVFVEGSLVYDHDLSITPKSGIEGFLAVATAVKPPVVFYYYLELTEEDFLLKPLEPSDEDSLPLRPEVSIKANSQVKSFLGRIGEAQALTLYFLYEGHQIVTTIEADWSADFQQVCEVAYEEELHRQEARKEEERQAFTAAWNEGLERSEQRLKAELPADPEFCRLACVSRPRVTDLRKRAAEILGKEAWFPYQGALAYTIRLTAEEIKAAGREAKKQK